jgi:anti-sigma factor (TIGR02949 family)
MLSCQDCEKYLDAFLDQALAVKESLDIQEHLRACPPCTSRADAERTLRVFIRQHAAPPPVPEELKQRIVRQAMQAPQQPWWRWSVSAGVIAHARDFVMGVAAAVVLLLVFSAIFATPRGDDMTQRFVKEASMTYGTYKTEHMPPEVVSADDKVVTQWINNHMGDQMKVPCITDSATKLQGGRLCRLLDRKSAALMYERHGVDLLLFAFKGEPLSLPAKQVRRIKDHVFYLQNVGGRPVAMWQHGGITYSIVGDMPPDELLQVATTINYR